MRRLSKDDHERLHAAIAAAEAKTKARFACVVLPASDRYTLYPVVWAAVLALLAGAILALVIPDIGLRTGVIAEVVLFAVIALVFDWFPARLLLVPRRAKHEHARSLAHREFGARILAPSDHRDGVLFFISLAERYVEVVATQGVHAKVGDASWNAIMAEFLTAARDDRLVDGALSAIDACASHLAAHFPK